MRSFLIFLVVSMFPAASLAQALSPMQGEVRTYSHNFALLLTAANPYNKAQRFNVTVKDTSGAVAQRVYATAPNFTLPPGENGAFYVWGDTPPGGRIQVCVTSQFMSNGRGAQVRGEVCGKYVITRVGG